MSPTRPHAARKAERGIVFLHSSDYCGGAERSLVDLAAGLQARGHRVEVWNAGNNPELVGWLADLAGRAGSLEQLLPVGLCGLVNAGIFAIRGQFRPGD